MSEYSTDEYSSPSDGQLYSNTKFDNEFYDFNCQPDSSMSCINNGSSESLHCLSSDIKEIPKSTLELASTSHPITSNETSHSSGINNTTFPYAPVCYPLSDAISGTTIESRTFDQLFQQPYYNNESTISERSSIQGILGQRDIQEELGSSRILTDGLRDGINGGCGTTTTATTTISSSNSDLGNGNWTERGSVIPTPNLVHSINNLQEKDSFKIKSIKKKSLSLSEIPELLNPNKKRKIENNNNDDNKILPVHVLNKLSLNLLSDLKELNLVHKTTLTDHHINKHIRRGSSCDVTVIISGLSHYDEKIMKLAKKFEDAMLDYSIAPKDIIIFQNPSVDPKYHHTYLNTLGFIYNAIITQQATSLHEILSMVADQITIQSLDLHKQLKSKPTQQENNSDFLPINV